MWDHFSIYQWYPQNLVDRKQFQLADHLPVKHTGPLGEDQAHGPRLTISDLDHLASCSFCLNQ